MRRVLVAIVWLAIFGLSLLRVSFLNDHFDRISRGRQILTYGDRPFADFRDPGYFLTLYVSAAAQASTGGGLLGEALVASAAIASAGALTFWLAESASGSLLIGLLAAWFAWVVSPRYYDYDKVLFYMAGLAACWRYADAPTRGRLVTAAVVTALAALFRYDNGLYVMVACIAAIAIRRRDSRSMLLSDLTVYLVTVVIVAAPALVFVQMTAGISEAVRQVATYAMTEGQRSRLFTLPSLGFDRVSLIYLFIVMSGPAALALSRDAKTVAAALFCICVSVFVLRDPISARLGAAAPLAAVLAAGIAGRWQVPRFASTRAIALVVGAAAMAVAAVYPQRALRLVRAPYSVAVRLAALSRELRASPPVTTYFPDRAALAGLASYLRTCTPSDARVMLTWFAPEVFFFSQRGFAGGMTVFLGSHWSSEADQRRTIEQVERQVVPLVIVETNSEESFRSNFPVVATYVDGHYRLAATTSFADPRVGDDGYRVLIRQDLDAAKRESQWQLPCPAR